MRLYRALRCCCDFISTSSHFVLVRCSHRRRRRCCFFFLLLFGLLFNFFSLILSYIVFTHATVGPCRRCNTAHRPRDYVCIFEKKKITYIALLRVLSLNISNAIFVFLAIALGLMCTIHVKNSCGFCVCA